MGIDLKGIDNKNEYYTNHYFSTVFEENESDTLKKWRDSARESEGRTTWSFLRDAARQYGVIHERYARINFDAQTLQNIRDLADKYLAALGYPVAKTERISIDEDASVPVYLEMKKSNGAPLLWVLLSAAEDSDTDILERNIYDTENLEDITSVADSRKLLSDMKNEDLATKIMFSMDEPPRFLIIIGLDQIVLIDRNKWNEKRYLQFELDEIFGRREETTLQTMSVLLHKDSLCPEEGKVLLDEFDENSQRNASGVSQDLKYALRESIELLGNEVIYDMANRKGRDLSADPVDASELTLQCLRYMYRMLFVLFIESRQDLGYAPMKSQVYVSAYSLQSLRDIAEQARDDAEDIGESFYLFDSLQKLYGLIYSGYPKTEEELKKYEDEESHHDEFCVPPLKAHIFDPERTSMITESEIRNHVLLRIIDLMSVTRGNGKKGSRGRISYSNLGINQMGAVYEALLSYRGFIAEQDLYEVKQAGSSGDVLEVGYFVPESELDQYTEDERVYEIVDSKHKKLKMYHKGTFIYRLAGREREKSASYYTPEVLTKCLVKYSLKELLKGKSADDVLNLKICEPAMGSAAFLNEAIDQLAEAYLDLKQKEREETISYDKRQEELQKVKMYIADRNVYGIDLNPTAVELAEVSLWLNTIYDGGYVPWFGTQLVNGNSLIGARKQCYSVAQLQTSSNGLRWYETAPERVTVGAARKDKNYQMQNKQVYHFLLGDPGMSEYTDKVIKQLEPDNIKKIDAWRKSFTKPYDDSDVKTLLDLSKTIDDLWNKQVKLRKEVDEDTQDKLSVYGHEDTEKDSHTTIREKDRIYSEKYKSEHMKNAGPYARLKFAMDYWCSLWFWPIDMADLLPTRSEFLFDMSIILIGTQNAVHYSSEEEQNGQLSLFPTEYDQLAFDFAGISDNKEVDIPKILENYPRLALAHEIAEQQKFMHWELEFADLFADRGGFDLVIGNPPWIKITWIEKDTLSDNTPIFAVRNLTATQTKEKREEILASNMEKHVYSREYVDIASKQNFQKAVQNYASLSGLQGNLYEGFLPQSWTFANDTGVFSLIHPESVFTDPKGVRIRYELNARMRIHFKFSNALKLFEDVHSSREFGLNVYSNVKTSNIEQIVNLYAVSTIEECYENAEKVSYGIRNEKGERNLKGNKDRVIHIGENELKLFARIFDNSENWKSARLMSVYSRDILQILSCFDHQKMHISDLQEEVFTSMMWDETNAQNNKTIIGNVHFGNNRTTILSGTHIGIANPLFNCSNRNCRGNNDNTSVLLSEIPNDYIQRTNYSPNSEKYNDRIPITSWGQKVTDKYRIAVRKMIDIEGERTLVAALIPPQFAHTNGIISFIFRNNKTMILVLSGFISLPFDLFIKVCGNLKVV